MFNSSMDSLHFTLEVRATGWVGFGVATQAPNNMTYYDVAVGGVVNGSGYLKVNCLNWLSWDCVVLYSHAGVGRVLDVFSSPLQ